LKKIFNESYGTWYTSSNELKGSCLICTNHVPQ
jgi:hypothetical protein